MRNEPFEQEPKPAGTESWRQHTIDLTEHMSKTATDNVAGNAEDKKDPPAAEPAGTATSTGTFTQNEPADPTPAKEFDEFVNQLEQADAVTLANILVNIFNVGRVFFVPNFYWNLTFMGQERFDVKTVQEKAAANMKQNKAPEADFNDYEKYLYKKLPKLQTALENVSYTNQEIDGLAELLARRIKEMTVSVFLVRYMWILMILWLEIKHGQFIIEQKGADFFNNKMGLNPAKKAA